MCKPLLGLNAIPMSRSGPSHEVGKVQQRLKFKMDENGGSAASATSIFVESKGTGRIASRQMYKYFNPKRPFFEAIWNSDLNVFVITGVTSVP